MTLGTLLLYIGIAAIVLTGGVLALKRNKNVLITYLQNFCGALFLFSGWVKAVDPLGTAYKMEQYFAEFESTFEATWFSFLAPMFPFLSNYSIGFSVGMIVFEIVLGAMLLIGMTNKWTSWAFLSLVVFFTFLTGFTYLTGYVPNDVNFFQFGSWGPYVESNMKVTDCGCFGDFIKLKPKTSFFKDVFLLIPAILFVLQHKNMHELFTSKVRGIITGIVTVGTLVYCISNYSWDLPDVDFRPFAVENNVAEIKRVELEAAANVQVTDYKLTNKSSGEVVSVPYAEFMKRFQEFPKEEWEYEQIRSKPAIEATKVSEYSFQDEDGIEYADDLLADDNYHFLIVCYKYYYDTESETVLVNDTTYVADTIVTADTSYVVQKIDSVKKREASQTKYIWDTDYQKIFKNKINPLAEAAEKAGYKVTAVVGGAGPEAIEEFRHSTQTAYPFYMADDILLKTIVRSNPGVVLFKNGKIVNKWHHKKLPSFAEMEAKKFQ
ncbi:MAG: DoxX family protein [Saprospiraceae bacterium]